ncbi:MAG: hypothetical protein ISS15_21530 [Alphaproteobacteria bacterium]|nr:hypothetical protein [Alphaproteobacteria bacterium]MBL6940163.1 hypothetical protein [Alphaproteobacteria bacterium]MBL7100250.1 hypothetical protein [Alphaproteobacteria bacterium]
MSLAHDDDKPPALASVLPSEVAEKRDALGNFCFYLHFAVMITIVLGWLAPVHALLVFYVYFLPAVATSWLFNRNSCVLNNAESLIRYGRWRDPNNKEEGAWLLGIATRLFGYPFKAWHIDALTYAVLAAVWAAGLSHLLWW